MIYIHSWCMLIQLLEEWIPKFIQNIQGWLQKHSKTNSEVCIDPNMLRIICRMFQPLAAPVHISYTPILYLASGFIPGHIVLWDVQRLDSPALRSLQKCAAGHGVSRQPTAGRVVGLVVPRSFRVRSNIAFPSHSVISNLDE